MMTFLVGYAVFWVCGMTVFFIYKTIVDRQMRRWLADKPPLPKSSYNPDDHPFARRPNPSKSPYCS
jgi:hypothetical protein